MPGQRIAEFAETPIVAEFAAFVADAEGKRSHDFPEWNSYRKAIGESQPAGALFVEMLEAEPELCASIGGDAKQLNKVLDKRVQALKATLRDRKNFKRENGRITGPPTLLGSVAAVFFAGTNPNAKPDFVRNSQFLAVIAVTGKWIAGRFWTDYRGSVAYPAKRVHETGLQEASHRHTDDFRSKVCYSSFMRIRRRTDFNSCDA